MEATGSPDALTAKLHDVMVAKLNELQEEYADLYGPYPAGAYWVPARLGGGAPTLEEATAPTMPSRPSGWRKRRSVRTIPTPEG